MAPVIKALEGRPDSFEARVCVSGQHRQMLDQALKLFDITPHHDLNIMLENQTLHDITARSIVGMREVMDVDKPDIVLVQGDTTTTFVGGLAAFYAKIPVGHVEAGLRTNDKYRPFPEEINRRLTTQVADFHFAPTAKAKDNLLGEGIDEKNVFVTGNTVVDALHTIAAKHADIEAEERWTGYFRDEFGIKFNNGKRTILVTSHRRENFGKVFQDICEAIRDIVSAYEVRFVYPVHPNPNVREPVTRSLGDLRDVHLIKPLNYEPFVYLMSKSYLILTDSGGVQEEAPSLGKPVLVTRDKTERPEAVEAGTVRLVGTDRARIVSEITRLLEDDEYYRSMSTAHNPYGDGHAAGRIADILEQYFS